MNIITADQHLARYGGEGAYAPTKDDYYGVGYIAISATGGAWTDPMRTSIPAAAGWWRRINGATRFDTIEQAAAVAGVVEILVVDRAY